MAVTQAAEKVVVELKKRAAAIWDISPEAVEWKDGKAFPAGPNAGSFEPLSLQEIALKAGRAGGARSGAGVVKTPGARARRGGPVLGRAGGPANRDPGR